MAKSNPTSLSLIRRYWQVPTSRRVLISFGAFMGYVAYDYAAWKFSKFMQIHEVVENLHKGRFAPVPNTYYVLERKEAVDFVDKLLHSSTKVAAPSTGKASSTKGLFNLLVGPLGCGKTWCVTTAINRNPKVSTFVEYELCIHVLFLFWRRGCDWIWENPPYTAFLRINFGVHVHSIILLLCCWISPTAILEIN